MTNETKKLEILVIEDNPQYVKDAQKSLSEQEGIEVTYAVTFREAEQRLAERQYDGIISDLFFPTGYEGSTDDTEMLRNGTLRYRSMDRINAELRKTHKIDLEMGKRYSEAELVDMERKVKRYKMMNTLYEDTRENWALAPLGGLVPDIAGDTPVIICTSETNHAIGAEEIRNYRHKKREQNGVIAGSGYDHATGKTTAKNWESAIGVLLNAIRFGSIAAGSEEYYRRDK